MLCEQILGNIHKEDWSAYTLDTVDVEWHEAFKKLHKKVTAAGEEIGIRLDDSILTVGLRDGDVLYKDEEKAVVVKLLPCEVLEVRVAENHDFMIPKVCYEIGNRHASLFYGSDDRTFITPYTEPLEKLLNMHGVSVCKKMLVLDFDKRISASINAHTH